MDVIVGCGLPVSIVDNPRFCAFLSKMDPKYSPPCRQTVTYSILPELRKDVMSKLHALLDNSTDIGLTADIWTDRKMHAYLDVTVHVFNNGKPLSCLLSFQSFKGSHTGQKIAEALDSVINDNNLLGKIRAVVTDNASNMRKALTVLLEASDDPEDGSGAVDTGNVDIEDVDDPSLWDDDDILTDMNFIADNISVTAEQYTLFCTFPAVGCSGWSCFIKTGTVSVSKVL
jgi:hypothetical protein